MYAIRSYYEPTAQERLWRNAFFGGSALMAAFALVDLDAGRYAAAAGDAGVSCLLLSLMNQFPLVRAIVGATSRGGSPEELQREIDNDLLIASLYAQVV